MSGKMKNRPCPINIETPNTVSNFDTNFSGLTLSDNDELDTIIMKLKVNDKQASQLRGFFGLKDKVKKEELTNDAFEKLGELGMGNGGVVYKVKHKMTGIEMARKLIHVEIKPAIKQQILRELEVLHKCISPYIIGYYGYFYDESDISICMECMNGGSLDLLMKKCGRIPEALLSKISHSVLRALDYLRTEHQILHRDVKPSNILVNTNGEIKMCDFGVSGQLTDSMAKSFVGTRSYMSPERLLGQEYSVQSDIWSVGLSLVEMALGRYPIPLPTANELTKSFVGNVQEANEQAIKTGAPLPIYRESTEKSMSVFDMLECVVNSELPNLPPEYFSPSIVQFVNVCLKREPRERADLATLLSHPFITDGLARLDIDFGAWVTSVSKNEPVVTRHGTTLDV